MRSRGEWGREACPKEKRPRREFRVTQRPHRQYNPRPCTWLCGGPDSGLEAMEEQVDVGGEVDGGGKNGKSDREYRSLFLEDQL